MKQHQAEIDAIINNPEAPTFKNTIDALETSGSSSNVIPDNTIIISGQE